MNKYISNCESKFLPMPAGFQGDPLAIHADSMQVRKNDIKEELCHESHNLNEPQKLAYQRYNSV